MYIVVSVLGTVIGRRRSPRCQNQTRCAAFASVRASGSSSPRLWPCLLALTLRTLDAGPRLAARPACLGRHDAANCLRYDLAHHRRCERGRQRSRNECACRRDPCESDGRCQSYDRFREAAGAGGSRIGGVSGVGPGGGTERAAPAVLSPICTRFRTTANRRLRRGESSIVVVRVQRCFSMAAPLGARIKLSNSSLFGRAT